MPKDNIDYSNTIIYKIYCKDDSITDIYVGHTTNFNVRKYQHKNACNNCKINTKIYNSIRANGGWDNWDMVEIAKYNCKDSTEARIKEQYHYEQLKASLNSCPPYVDSNKFYCETCDIQSTNLTQYNNHIKSNSHLKKIEETESNDDEIVNTQNSDDIETIHTQNISEKFNCEVCNYSTYVKYNYKLHVNTKKHKNNVLSTNDNETQGNSSKKFECDICHKNYNDRTGLWKHKKKCCKKDDEINEISDKELMMMIIKQNAELIKENSEIKNMMLKFMELGIKNTTNCNNVTIDSNSINNNI